MEEKSSGLWLSVAIVIIIIVGAIYWMGSASYTPPAVEPATTPDQTAPVTTITPPVVPIPTLGVASSTKLGDFLVAVNGMTLYTSKTDKPNKSNCAGTCATNWPPYMIATSTDLVVNPDLSGTLNTISRDDGTLQVTYNGMPLYFWTKDVNPGDTTGDGVGKVWYAAKK